MTTLGTAAGAPVSGPRAAARVLVIFGTRPEAIKLAPVVRALQEHPLLEPVVCSTGQHKEMLSQMLDTMRLAPDHELALMQESQPLAGLTSAAVGAIAEVIGAERPAAVVVQGDTTTCLCGALAAFYANVPVAHVEAGLRSGCLRNPFPEELNRRLVTQMARWHFAPTEMAAANLRREGIDRASVMVTGNTGIDNLLWVRRRALGRSGFTTALRKVLVTMHRRESQGPTMLGMAAAVSRLAALGGIEVLLPLHKSPTVRRGIAPALADVRNVTLTEPLDYLDFTASLADADLVLTDSGGVQEEAASLGKPVLVLRDATERPEGIAAGVARLAGTDPGAIYREAVALLTDPAAYAAMARPVDAFGDGNAAELITARLAADIAGAARARMRAAPFG